MKIVKRVKNKNKVIGYIIDTGNNETTYFDKNRAINMASVITNAVLLKDKSDYKGKAGVIIESIQSETRNSIEVHQKPKMELVKVPQNSYSGDYYGREFINVCRKLRSFACAGNISVDMGSHKSNGGNNTHLFKLIESCGVSVKELVVGYLSVIQPYSLQLFQDSKGVDKKYNIWITDIGYGIKLVIKVNYLNPNAPVVVSFHESNTRKGTSNVRGGADFRDKPCAVLIDSFCLSKSGNYYKVSYFVQRGFIREEIISNAIALNNDVALINHMDIKTCFDDILSNIYSDLYTTYTEKMHRRNNFSFNSSMTSGVSFMAYGYEVTNNICYMIDLFAMCRDNGQKRGLIDLALSMLETLDDKKADVLKIALSARFNGSNNGLYLAVRENL